MPKPGDILLYKNYIFEDNTKKDKLFVVLNEADENTPCLVLKTTSQSKQYLNVRQGCNITKKVFFAPSSMEKCFDEDTYIKLQIIPFSIKELIEGSLSKNITILPKSLSSLCFYQLKKCLKLMKNDIPQRFHSILF